jgi:hypothetical protein
MKKPDGITEHTINRNAFISVYLFDVPKQFVAFENLYGRSAMSTEFSDKMAVVQEICIMPYSLDRNLS